MSRRDRRDSDRRDNERRDGDRRPGDRRDMQPDDDQQRRTNEPDPQESDSLTALKAILGKVANLLQPLQLTPDESIRLVEQLYGSVLDMDVKLAGETDDRRKSSVLAHIQNITVVRKGDKTVVEYPAPDAAKPGQSAEVPAEAQIVAETGTPETGTSEAGTPETGGAQTRSAETGEVATPAGALRRRGLAV
jgi:hypothetical protein